ncbi:MAG: alpha/beta hydrolase [Candidatus Acidiferrales bacterium]
MRAHGLSAQDIAGCVSMGSILHIEHQLAEAKDRSPEEIARAFEASSEGKLYSSYQAFHDSWAFYHVGPHLPPMLLLVAETEIEQPPILAHSRDFARAAEKAGIKVEVVVLKDRTHMSAIEKMTDPADPTFRLVLSFLQKH